MVGRPSTRRCPLIVGRSSPRRFFSRAQHLASSVNKTFLIATLSALSYNCRIAERAPNNKQRTRPGENYDRTACAAFFGFVFTSETDWPAERDTILASKERERERVGYIIRENKIGQTESVADTDFASREWDSAEQNAGYKSRRRRSSFETASVLRTTHTSPKPIGTHGPRHKQNDISTSRSGRTLDRAACIDLLRFFLVVAYASLVSTWISDLQPIVRSHSSPSAYTSFPTPSPLPAPFSFYSSQIVHGLPHTAFS